MSMEELLTAARADEETGEAANRLFDSIPIQEEDGNDRASIVALVYWASRMVRDPKDEGALTMRTLAARCGVTFSSIASKTRKYYPEIAPALHLIVRSKAAALIGWLAGTYPFGENAEARAVELLGQLYPLGQGKVSPRARAGVTACLGMAMEGLPINKKQVAGLLQLNYATLQLNLREILHEHPELAPLRFKRPGLTLAFEAMGSIEWDLGVGGDVIEAAKNLLISASNRALYELAPEVWAAAAVKLALKLEGNGDYLSFRQLAEGVGVPERLVVNHARHLERIIVSATETT